jgi:hypothetical protein
VELERIKLKIINALNKFYSNDYILLKEKLCERCLVHRIAIYLEQEKFPEYFIDCEYNKSHLNQTSITKNVINKNGNYIDIIITKRDNNPKNDLVCFEVKRWNNYNGRPNDRDKLKELTKGDKFGYDYGFYIILNNCKDKTIIEVYSKGEQVEIFRLGKANEV